jgi:hypothetical protein
VWLAQPAENRSVLEQVGDVGPPTGVRLSCIELFDLGDEIDALSAGLLN